MDVKKLLFFLKKSTFYRALRPILSLYLRKDRNVPFRIWVDFLCHLMERACSKKEPIVWVNAFFPTEIVHAMGALPIIPEIHASLFAYFNYSRRFIEIGGGRLSTDICSFFRCAMGLLEEGFIPKPDLVLSSSHLCDGSAKFFSEAAKKLGVKHFYLDIPISPLRGVKERLARKLKDLSFEVASYFWASL